MKYSLNKKAFKKRLLERGYKDLSDFAAKATIHRNTLQNFLKGKNVFSAGFTNIVDALQIDPLEVIRPEAVLDRSIQGRDMIAPIVAKLVQQDKDLSVILIGSRTTKKAKKYSDWDLALFRHPNPLSGREYLRLKRMVSDESENCPISIDLINLNQAPTWFLKDLGEKPVFLDGNREAYTYLLGVLDGIQREKAA